MFFLLIIFLILTIILNNPQPIYAQTSISAFPGAEGFGANSIGGRGGRVIEVTNLNDSGTGSLRACIEASDPRICIFRIGGTITLNSMLRVSNPYITIAGQSAPGDGITLKNIASATRTPLNINAHDVVIRYIRIRPGPPPAGEGANVDALGITNGAYNVVVDHCSFSWATDEVVQFWYSPHDVTIQWSLISEGLLYSSHPEGGHSCGMIIGSDGAENISVHHNLMAHNRHRNPLIKTTGIVDMINNVIYNCQGKPAIAADEYGLQRMNFVSNYYKKGPNSDENILIGASEVNGYGFEYYVRGNICPNRSQDTMDEDLAVASGDRGYIVSTKHQSPAITTYSCNSLSDCHAYNNVLTDIGANKGLNCDGTFFQRQDSVDERIINDVIQGTGNIINDPSEVGGWPTLISGTPCVDSDNDGMANDWENNYGFNPGNSSDGSLDADNDGYTNLEEFLNGTDPKNVSPSPLLCPADINADGQVNQHDLRWVLSLWGQNSSGAEDLYQDNKISALDLASVILNWGSCSVCRMAGEDCGSSFDCCEGLICDLDNKTCRSAIEEDKYFQIQQFDESFCLYVNNDSAIKAAWDSYQGVGKYGPQGPIIRNSGGFNYGYGCLENDACLPEEKGWRWWNWHFDPTHVQMTEASIEVCDGTPSAVEYRWSEGQIYCPWSVQIAHLGCIQP